MMVKYYKKIFGMSGAPVHEIIIEESIKLLPEEIQQFLSEKIDGNKIPPIATLDHHENWRIIKKLDTMSLSDLIIEGGRAEDQSYRAKKYYVDDRPMSSIFGVSVPSLTHYWCYELYKSVKKDVGLITVKNVKTPFWWVPGVNVIIEKILQMLSKKNIPYQSALSRALIYWEDDIFYYREKYNDPTHRAEIFLILGRILHLLTDVGVPAHIHCDTHIPYFDPDSYEFNVGFWMNEHKRIWKVRGDEQIFFNDKWESILLYFTRYAEISSLFDSDDVDGFGKGKPYRWPKKERLGISGYLSQSACKQIGNILIPLAFRITAGIILLFFKIFFPSFWKDNRDKFLKNTTDQL
ncbi:MAG: hypothetical protein ACTSWG_11000 [Candidatus Helarchaeota archaeon]